jgi:hypothetical protein
MYKPYIEARSCSHGYRVKAKSITYSEFVSIAFVIQHAKHMRPIIMSDVARLAVA